MHLFFIVVATRYLSFSLLFIHLHNTSVIVIYKLQNIASESPVLNELLLITIYKETEKDHGQIEARHYKWIINKLSQDERKNSTMPLL